MNEGEQDARKGVGVGAVGKYALRWEGLGGGRFGRAEVGTHTHHLPHHHPHHHPRPTAPPPTHPPTSPSPRPPTPPHTPPGTTRAHPHHHRHRHRRPPTPTPTTPATPIRIHAHPCHRLRGGRWLAHTRTPPHAPLALHARARALSHTLIQAGAEAGAGAGAESKLEAEPGSSRRAAERGGGAQVPQARAEAGVRGRVGGVR